jgi:hypothetical protein
MIFDSINLKDELYNSENETKSLMSQVSELFENEKIREQRIRIKLSERAKSLNETIVLNPEDFDKIYSLETIEKISIKYNLRFLDTEHFKSEFPYEAIMKIKNFENKYKLNVTSFKILAPHEVFKLTDVNADPLLFVPLADNKYYLMHKWGTDLAWYKAILNYPFRNILTFLKSVLVFSFIFQMCIPTSWFNLDEQSVPMFRLWLTTHCFIGFFSFFLFLGSLSFKGFSSSVWQSKHFN